MANPKKYLKQIAALEAFLTEEMKLGPNEKLTVNAWLDKGGGFRIAEIDIVTTFEGGKAGSCYMQGDANPACYAILFAAERFVVAHGVKPFTPEGWSSAYDEFGDAKDALRNMLEK